MLDNFFQLTAIPANHMVGTYDIRLVFLSYLVATLASYIALDITARLRDITNTNLSMSLWIVGGAIAMGAGIWSMHFIGMLAFHLNMPMSYDPFLTFLSMLVAVFASGFALFLLKSRVIRVWRLIFGGVILGFAIAAMHYTGMAAMTDVNIHYLPGLFLLSIIVAILASEAALYLALKSTTVIPRFRIRLKIVSALIMGAAICGMHYTGMAAAIFTMEEPMVMNHAGSLDPELMALIIAAVTMIILGVAFVVSTYKESINQQMLFTARQAGMAEVAASVLHNINNLLNSVSVSSKLVEEKISDSKLSGLNDLHNLLKAHQDDLMNFICNDERGKHLPAFIMSLAEYWENEKLFLDSEAKTINRNVEHIRNIIATQQDLSRVAEFEQVVSIENVLEESILICGIESGKFAIKTQKDYELLKPVLIDKVKLLQILVNLIQNAKDSVIDAKKREKVITFTMKSDNNNFFITITDNGIGIEPQNINRIFAYGFTTKKSGHGFGLHTSAISAKEMGGELVVESEGLNHGATFKLILPYRYQ